MLKTFFLDFLIPYLVVTLAISVLSQGFIAFSMLVAIPVSLAYLLALNAGTKLYSSILIILIVLFSLFYFLPWQIADMFGKGLGGVATASISMGITLVAVVVLLVARPIRNFRMRKMLKGDFVK